MTLGRCSMRAPAEAVTPAMSPSDISAAATACAVGASSFARLAATNTVTPELGESGMPAGGSPTAKPGCATLTPIPARTAPSRSRPDRALECLAGELLQRRGDAALGLRRQRSRRLQLRELELGLARALARLREERIVAEARHAEAREHHREEEQREPLLQVALAI